LGSLALNGFLLWAVQALDFSKTSDKTKDYFSVELVRLDTSEVPKTPKPQSEKPIIPLHIPSKLAPSSAPPLPIKQEAIPTVTAPSHVSVTQEIALGEKAPLQTEPPSTLSVRETARLEDGHPGGETEAGPLVSATTFVPISQLTRIPTFSRRVEPVYPETERRFGKESYAMAEINLDEKGSITEINIIQSGGKPFDLAVEIALRKSLLTPGYIKDKPVPVRVQIPFIFRLR
jgi:TonB family protein